MSKIKEQHVYIPHRVNCDDSKINENGFLNCQFHPVQYYKNVQYQVHGNNFINIVFKDKKYTIHTKSKDAYLYNFNNNTFKFLKTYKTSYINNNGGNYISFVSKMNCIDEILCGNIYEVGKWNDYIFSLEKSHFKMLIDIYCLT